MIGEGIEREREGYPMRHIIDLCDLTEKEFSDLYKLTTNILGAASSVRRT